MSGIAKFFIDHPIGAMVLSIVITVAGVVAVLSLPIAQYPEIAPPTVQVFCVYPGASAKVVAETVAAPIEQQVNGVENMLYIMLVVNLVSPEGRHDQLYLSNYATIQVKDELARLEGVGDVAFLGQQDYSMRVWLDPQKLDSRSMTAGDVVAALRDAIVLVAIVVLVFLQNWRSTLIPFLLHMLWPYQGSSRLAK